MTGSRPSGTLPASRPTAKTMLFLQRQSGAEDRDRNEGDRHRDRDRGDQPGDFAHLCFKRAGLLLDALGQRGDATELGAHPGREHDAACLSAGGAGATEQQVLRGDPRDARVDQVGRAQRRRGLAVERRQIDLDGAGDHPHVGGDAVALLDEHDVSGDELDRDDLREVPSRSTRTF